MTEEEKKTGKSDVALKEEATQRFWEERDIFKKSENRGEEEFVFYDGPPFATGLPHYGHILAGTIKDAIPRYQVMRGKRLRRRWGWDCHGLPLENQIEAELGIKTKKDIEELGVATFVEKARSAVLRYAEDWKRIIPRLGRFVDMEDDYRTMDSTYTESVWWAFKTLYDKDLIYKNFKSMHLCPRCGTTLSNFEVNQGYKDITDLSVTIKFHLKPGQKFGKYETKDTAYLLAWTTTPWTLPGNVALAVNTDFSYTALRVAGVQELYILASDRVAEVFKEKDVEIVHDDIKGEDLVGLEYTPLFDYYVNENLDNKENAWKVYAAPYVTLEDGTGIVHLAPAFGAEDMLLARQHKIPLIHHVGMDGKFTDKVRDFAGLEVKPKDDHQRTDIEIVKYLAHNNLLFAKAKVTHSYPHCWRCDTPLLNYAATSWFVKVPEIKSQIVKENKEIHWVPQSVGEYRFGNWLEGSPDWAISRSRFWGAPLPVWENAESGKRLVIGSLEELRVHMPRSGNRYFVMRHGEAESNILDIISSDPASTHGLTEVGKEQVREAARSLVSAKIDMIVTSPFLRTKESAEILCTELGIPRSAVREDPRLGEINAGIFSGRLLSEYRGYFKTFADRFSVAPEGGENYAEVKRRMGEALYSLEKEYAGKNILILSHKTPIRMLFGAAQGNTKEEIREEDFHEKNGLRRAEARELAFTPLPHNDDYELDFHRPYIDEVVLRDEEGREYRRVPEVFDCWFESGSMPYAQDHYPFKKDYFDPESGKGYPADFIAEGLDQTRGWFYSLLVLGVALFGRSPYKHVIVNGLVLAEDGQKMSKRLKNYPDPMDVADKYGADAMRLYLLSSPIVQGADLNFSERGVDEILKKNILRLENVLAFYELYAKEHGASAGASEHLLDRWILSRLNHTVMEVTKGMEAYELDTAVRPVFSLIDDLSTWYLRRSRERIKEGGAEAAAALATLREVLRTTALLLAPFAPFVAERVYAKVKEEGGEESVHLSSWPEARSVLGAECLSLMDSLRSLVTLALEERTKKGMKVRQPLALLRVPALAFSNDADRAYAEDILRDEVNVKSVEFSKDLEGRVELDTALTPELEEEGRAREFMRAVQDFRKKLKLEPNDRITLTLSEEPSFVARFRADIAKTVNAESIALGAVEGEHAESEGVRFSLLKR